MKAEAAGSENLLLRDPLLKPYAHILEQRHKRINQTVQRLTQGKTSLEEFACGHEYFGLHFRDNGWVFREWAPNARRIYLIGEMSGWQETETYALKRLNPHGEWEIRLPKGTFNHGDLYRLRIHWEGGDGDRIPAYARRVVQDPQTLIFNAQVWCPAEPYEWEIPAFTPPDEPGRPLYIYEAHVGMAQDAERVGTFREFTETVLPRIVAAGYNTVQLMAIQEHPYYASFGYQVSSFFAAASRFGPPEDLKRLIDAAHGAGLRVLMDLVHSHAVANEVEGLSRFDGTPYQYFHEGAHGYHPGWNSRCFDYAKPEVLHFLLSNCRFWLDEYHFDGFRFDGVTSMLYFHRGLEKSFTSYDDYFNEAVDEDALTYLTLANRLIHTLYPQAITIAEDVSGLPGLAAPAEQGGCGFDCRLAMGVPDYWIRLTKDIPDPDWPMGHLWFELTNRRADEKTISYAESHDQALVGDQTLIFRLIGSAMYEHMQVADDNLIVDRGMALHKLIRLITLATAANGYLNFMGNEFGHPEWIDFPRQGNGWSYRFARRQWHLADDPALKYRFLGRFDRDMLDLARRRHLLASPEMRCRLAHPADKVLAFERGRLLFVFNFHPDQSWYRYPIDAEPGTYRMCFDSDAAIYGGHGRLVSGQVHKTFAEEKENGKTRHRLHLYLPTRTAIVLEKNALDKES